ncbi:MAG: phosphoglucosamine mutase [Fimbriimonadaceae bacterium]|nr:phosphoglucosamine mutase [Fimbriimonadaceae bacterium]
MSRKHFGTDGIRGIANAKLTPELAFQLGQAAGRWLIETGKERHVVIGRDTRRSGPMLGAAIASGFCSVGVDVATLGVAPTPAVVYAARTGRYGLGVVISASHNPAPDNGIKLVGHDGRKLPDDVESDIERYLETPLDSRPTGSAVGYLGASRSEIDDYLEFLEGLVPNRLDGLKVALDGANGAAYELGPAILARLGAQVSLTGVSPDGMNINEECGATHPETVQALTKATASDIGVAFDGDADRAVFSDEQGRLINGDRTIGIWAVHHSIQPPTVVGTVMSNGGFEAYLKGRGFHLERTPVGDKYVAQKIAEKGARIGGEQSGHIIFPELQPTGDGLVTMLELLSAIKDSGRASSEWVDEYESWPQVLINVEVADRATWHEHSAVKEALEEAATKLAGKGRVNVRASGTQPIVRVMVEADNYGDRDRAADRILTALEAHAGAKVYSRVDLTHALGD